jgi:hypothetical protein
MEGGFTMGEDGKVEIKNYPILKSEKGSFPSR